MCVLRVRPHAYTVVYGRIRERQCMPRIRVRACSSVLAFFFSFANSLSRVIINFDPRRFFGPRKASRATESSVKSIPRFVSKQSRKGSKTNRGW